MKRKYTGAFWGMAVLIAAVWILGTVLGRNTYVDFPEIYPESALETAEDDEIVRKVDALLASMTEEEMYAMLGGSSSAASERGCGTGYVGGVPRLGVPVLRMWDGPKGVTGSGKYATTSPASELALASSFNEELAYDYGKMTALDNRAEGGNVQLGVQVDHVRTPFFRRSRDSLGEDPYLTSRMGDALSKGVEDHHVISTLKHLTGFSDMFGYNDNVNIDEQTLHEIYLAPYEYILKNGHASAVMTSYNQVNGVRMSENAYLLKTVLRDMWGFDGMVMVDWGGNHALSTHLGLDLEMSLLEYNTRENIEAAIEMGTMSRQDVTDAVRHTLTAMGKAGYLGLVQIAWNGKPMEDTDPPSSIELPVTEGEERICLLEENDRIALESALEGTVLLKNEEKVLPVDKDDDIALIGVLSQYTLAYSNESSFGWLEKMDGVYDEMREILGEDTKITAEIGLDVIGEPISAEFLYTTPECTEHGANLSIDGKTAGTVDTIRRTTGTVDGKPNRTFHNAEDGDALEKGQHAYYTAYLRVPKTDDYELQLLQIGGKVNADIVVDGEEISISGSGESPKWPSSGVVASQEGMNVPGETTKLRLKKGEVYQITVSAEALLEEKDTQFSLNWFRREDREEEYQAAVAAAAEHEKIIFFAYDKGQRKKRGTEETVTQKQSELSEDQQRLLEDVIQAAKKNGNKVIVVLNTMLPIVMDWLDDVDAVMEMWIPGQSGSKAAAWILTGIKNPSGKLPVTFPKTINDTQYGNFAENYKNETTENADYTKGGDGIFTGYRWYQKRNIEPQFAFGYGLSYTEFSYSDLFVEKETDGFRVTFTVTNTGEVTGTEIAQVYLGAAVVPEYVQMPEYKLAAFARVENLEPGESRTVMAKIETKELCYWDVKKDAEEGEEKWTVAEGERILYVGSSSDHLLLEQKIEVTDIVY